jgi:multiple sugar transport system permease protein
MTDATASATTPVAAAAAPRARRLEWKVTRGAALYPLMLALSVIFIFPFFWSVSSSLKTAREAFIFPPELLPAVPQWSNYVYLFTFVPYALWVGNTVQIAVLTTVGSILTSSIVAYSFARFKYRGRDLLFLITLSTMMLPSQVTLIPQYVLFFHLGWIDSFRPLWVPAWFGGGAFNIFLLRQFIMALPRDLDEAARVDGAGTFRVFWAILLPLCKPALAAVAVISFLAGWDDFLGPLIYLNSSEKFTIALGLRFFQIARGSEQGGAPTLHLLMAASILAVVPPILLFFFAQRYLIRGIVLSGIKG